MPDRHEPQLGDTRPSQTAAYRRQIYDAVVAHIAEDGFVDFTVHALCARAGFAPAAFHRFWPDAEAALFDLLNERGRLPVLPDTGTMRGDLVAYARDYFGSCSDPQFTRFMFNLTAEVQRNRVLAKRLKPGFEERRARNRVLMERASSRGELSPRTDPNAVLDDIFGLVMSWMGAGAAPPPHVIELRIDQIVERLSPVSPPLDSTLKPTEEEFARLAADLLTELASDQPQAQGERAPGAPQDRERSRRAARG